MPFDGRLCEPCTKIEQMPTGSSAHARMALQGESTRDDRVRVLAYRCLDCETDWACRIEDGVATDFTRTGVGARLPGGVSASGIKDTKRIDIDDPQKVAAWCMLLQRSEEEVRMAVRAVGPMTALLAVHLAKTRRRRPGDA